MLFGVIVFLLLFLNLYITTVQIIEEEQLQKNSLNVGTYFLLELEKLRNRLDIIGDVRGKV